MGKIVNSGFTQGQISQLQKRVNFWAGKISEYAALIKEDETKVVRLQAVIDDLKGTASTQIERRQLAEYKNELKTLRMRLIGLENQMFNYKCRQYTAREFSNLLGLGLEIKGIPDEAA